MTSMLRYVRYVKRLNEVGQKVTLNQQVLITGRKFILQNDQNLFKSYATAAIQSKIKIYGNNAKFQQFEDHVKRHGKISKSEIYALINEIEEIGNVSSLDGLLLIRSCGKSLYESDFNESIKLVQEVWSTLENLQTPMDVSHFNALLSVYLEKEYDFTPEDFLKFMEKKGVEPNRVTYQRLIKKYCQKGDIAGATKMLEIMKEKGMPLNEDVFNSLILGHSEANDMENALKILNVMKTAGISPSADTYTEVMCAYAKQGDFESIRKTLSEISQKDITLLDSHYLDVFYALAINGHTDKAENFLKEIPSEIHSDSEISRYLSRLIFANHTDLALKLLTETSKNLTRQKIRSGTLIRAMIMNKTPVEKIIKICRYLDEELQYNRAFRVALYQVLTRDPKLELASPLMKAWKEIGGEIREHYFWPLLVTEAKAGNMNGVADILKSMINDFQIMPAEETLKNYVLPYMFGTWESTITFFEPLNIPKKIVYNSIADRLLIERKIRLCATFVSSYPESYSKDLLLRHLVEALNARDDVESFTLILRHLSENSEPADPDKIPISLVDAALREVMDVIPEYRSKLIEKLLNEFVNAGLSMSPEVANEIRNYLNNSSIDDVEENLKKLSSGNLNIVPMEIYNPKVTDNSQDKIMNMRKILNFRRSFAKYADENNFEEAYEIIQKLQTAGYDEVGIYARAIRLFCDNEFLIGAESCVVFLKNNAPNATLDLKKIFKYAELLIKNDRFDDAIEFLTTARVANESEKNSKEIARQVRHVLETTSNKKDVENLNKLFNLLHSKNYLTIDNFSLGPMVKIHTLRGDYAKALEVFENACINHKCTPYKNMLIKNFIENEDADSLQKITDLNSEIFGESNALSDLAFCFLEYGQPKQAQKIFETPGLKIFNEKIASAIEHYDKYNKDIAINELVKVTKSVLRMDRSFLYDSILKLYQRKNNWQAGLALWTDMQEENVQPSAYFLSVLNSLLKQNNQSSPFVYDSSQSSITSSSQDTAFYDAVRQKNYDDAEKLLNTSSWTKQQAISKYNNLIMALLDHGELNRAYTIAKTLIDKYGVIDKSVFNELGYRLIESRKYKNAKELGNSLNPDIKKKVNYGKIVSHAEIAEKGLKYFIDNLKPADNNKYNENQIHFGAIVHDLLKNSEYVNEYEVWAKKMWDLGIHRTMHALWNYYFIVNDEREANIFDEYVSGNRTLLIKPITQVAMKEKNPALIEKLIEKIDKMPYVMTNIKTLVHSDLIKLYLEMNRPEDAFAVLRKFSRRQNLNSIPKKLLIALRDKYEMTGKKFPLIVEELNKSPIGLEYEDSQKDDKQLAQAEI
ncbi:leucine-rich PPR motif-containing protein, mitochondrial-like [Chelonus insularis]|uniref:leucine-rich PPR motif-containing protein, mitochondrial-like n=1 Tax=Chelonus insularis TaxID=460826 RepID=UPI001588E640|nr:leucine-rich PPR motif-containing protein, mitochondrial-like [Chelonus insularis]